MREFEFTAGSLSLNLVDTVSKRPNINEELLNSEAKFSAWLLAAGYDQEIEVDKDGLNTARRIREAAYDALSSVIDGAPIPKKAAEVLNKWSNKKDFRLQLTEDGITTVSDNPLQAVFTTIATDTLELLKPENRDRIRRCPECSMLFFDNSPPGKRRWCSSSSGCGNRAKVRRHRERAKQKAYKS